MAVGDFRNARLYALNGVSSIYIVNISGPPNMSITGSFNVSPNPRAMHVDGNYAYVAYDDGFKIIDISNPASPQYVAFYADRGIGAIKTSNGNIYIADDKGLRILHYAP